MIYKSFIGALALAAIALPGAALADDPRDPAMASAAARARDAEIIRRLNREELARTQARDAQYAAGWQSYREGSASGANADYASASRDYERQMAEWRRAVALCRSGRYEYCAR